MTSCCRLLVAVVAVCSVFPRAAQADQGDSARLIVTVTDATGGVLPTAAVRVMGLEEATRTPNPPAATADNTGVATIGNLRPGRYAIEAELTGFDKGTIREVRLRAGDNRQALVLQVSVVRDEVTVTQDRQEAAADRGVTFGTALTREQIDALSDDPEEMRQQLLDMAGPGAVIAVDSFEGGQLPPKAQIRSIRISRDQFAAENHFAGGTRIDIVTQPGIGPITGSMSTGFYDSALDGRNPLVGQRPPSRNQTFSTYISGTAIRDKMSFALQGSGSRNQTTPVLALPTASGTTYETAGLVATSRTTGFYGTADYALTRDQTLRFTVNRSTQSADNQGVGTFNSAERAFSSKTRTTSLYVQQTGPLGRRLVLNTRLAIGLQRRDDTSAVERETVVISQERTFCGAQRTGGDRTTTLTALSDLDYVRGLHSWRVGVSLEHYRYRTDAQSNYLGTYTFESLQAFEAGQPRSYTRRIGDPNVRYANTQVAVYVQDDIRVRKNLTLSPGLRYELQSLLSDRLNLAPRFGATWAPWKSGRTTFRASLGVFYDWLSTGTYLQTLQTDGLRQQEVNLLNPEYPDPGPLPAAPPVNRYLLDEDAVMPRSTRVSLGVSHTFNTRFSVNAVYADAHGEGLLVGENLNAPIDGARPDPAFANVIRAVPLGRSRQRTLTSNASINLAVLSPAAATRGAFLDWRRNLRVSVNHTVGDLRNNTDGAFATPATNNLADEWGPAGTDVRHRYGVSLGSGAVRGLSVSSSFSWMTAAPLTIRTGFDDNGDLIFNDRPAGVGRNSERTRGQFNSSASFGYQIPLGSRAVTSGSGISITSSGGGFVVNQVGQQTVPRYRLALSVTIQNLLNRANYSGFSGVQSSPSFLRPVSVSGVRRVNFNVGLSF